MDCGKTEIPDYTYISKLSLFYQEGPDFTELIGQEFELKDVTDDSIFSSNENYGDTTGLLVDEFYFTRETRMMGIDTYYDTYGDIYKALPVQVSEDCMAEYYLIPATKEKPEVIEDKSTLLIAILIPLAVLLFACAIISICVCRKKSKKKEASVTQDKDSSSDHES